MLITEKLPIVCVAVFIALAGCGPVPGEASLMAPVAHAGADQNISLPQGRQMTLDGSGSYDPDGATQGLAYHWVQLSGPTVGRLIGESAQGIATILEPGSYSFELTVRDQVALADRDTVNITAVWDMSCGPGFEKAEAGFANMLGSGVEVPNNVSIGVAGRSIIYTGGTIRGGGSSFVYDTAIRIYNLDTRETLRRDLSVGRTRISIVGAGDKVFLAGGIGKDGETDVIDIVDLTGRSMSKDKLSVARSSIAAISVGQKLFFAGGYAKRNIASDVVDVYDLSSKTWSVAKLSLPRGNITAVTNGTRIFFAGGDLNNGVSSTRIDIYDMSNGQWSIAELPVGRTMINSAVVGDEVAFVSGFDMLTGMGSGQVDFLNTTSLSLRTTCVVGIEDYSTTYGQNLRSASVKGVLYYLADGLIFKKQPGSQTWQVSYLPYDSELFALLSDGDQLYGLQGKYDILRIDLAIDILKINF